MAGEDRVYASWVRAQMCAVMEITGGAVLCGGVVEAHHAGERGLGRRAHDHTCVPLCTQHHREWHDAAGYFKTWIKGERRPWIRGLIEQTQARWREAFPNATEP